MLVSQLWLALELLLAPVAANLAGGALLGMGQTRTAKEIMSEEASGGGLSTGTLEGDAQAQELKSSVTTITNAVNKNCWSAYLDKNPAMKAWADANPAMAAQNKSRFDDC